MATITETQKINPNDLLVDLNVREDLNLDRTFVASIKDHGVLQPIVAVQTDEGLRVRYGHRRTRAAVEAGLDTVPVLIVATDAEGDAETIERLLTQHAENEHRAGLSTSEKIGVSHQLSLLGVSAAQIAKRTHTKRAEVDAHLSVSSSELATKATSRYDLTLDQAAAVAEFEDDPETVKALVAAAATGKFEHVAQRARQDRAEAEAKAPVIEALTADNVAIIDQPGYGDTAVSLTRLVDAEGNDLDPDEHRTCEGHAVWLSEVPTYTEPDGTVIKADHWGNVEWPEDKTPAADDEAEQRWEAVIVGSQWVPVAACTDYKAHGHRDRYDHSPSRPTAASMTEEEREAAKVARRLVIENNKAWKAAREVRREWIKTYLTRKTPPTQAGPFIARSLAAEPDLTSDTDANRIAADWFGADPATYGRSTDLANTCEAASDKRAQVLTLGLVLAGYEHRANDAAWRDNGEHSATGRYLRFLTELGYTLSDVEDYAVSVQTA